MASHGFSTGMSARLQQFGSGVSGYAAAFLVTYGCGRVQNDIQGIDWNNRAGTF